MNSTLISAESIANSRGSIYVPRASLDLVPVPEETTTYMPVSYRKLVGIVEEHAADILPEYTLQDESYCLAKCGQRMFGTLTFQTLAGFYNPTGVGSTDIGTVSIRYVDTEDDVETVLSVSAEVRLVLDFVCWADIDANGEVGFNDFLSMIEAFNTSSASPGWTLRPGESGVPFNRLDANGDAAVDFDDFVIFHGVFGSVCP